MNKNNFEIQNQIANDILKDLLDGFKFAYDKQNLLRFRKVLNDFEKNCIIPLLNEFIFYEIMPVIIYSIGKRYSRIDTILNEKIFQKRIYTNRQKKDMFSRD